jgi:putative transposase
MPRIARGRGEGLILHVINRGNGRQKVFHKDGDYQAFVELLVEAGKRFGLSVISYCIMPNHFHLLIQSGQTELLSKTMQWVMTSHVRRYHRHYGTSGHVWQGRYKSFIVQSNEHLITVIRYIEANPVRAGVVISAADWPWSSHQARICIVKDKMQNDTVQMLPGAWTEYVDTPLTDTEIEKVRISVNRQSPFGSDEWQQQTIARLGLESTVRRRGRPWEKALK